MTADRLDVIIFGATGFTGKNTVYKAVKLLANLKWGVAGRNKDKLAEILEEQGKRADTDLSKIPIIIAEVDSYDSVLKMAEQAKIIVNCCGPYRFFGEPVVKACINAGTHYVDVSGEAQFMERMQLEYNDLAKEKGVYIVSACGFDSIPVDLGNIFLESQFEGTVNSIESYFFSWSDGPEPFGARIHYGTWESAVNVLGNLHELKSIRSKLFTEKLPKVEPVLKKRPNIHKSDVVNKWCLPFLGADADVVHRTQRYFYENDKKRPVQMKAYIVTRSWLELFGIIVVGAFLAILSRFSLGKHLLLTYPKLFTFGFVSHEGPAIETMEKQRFKFVSYGLGWSKEDETKDGFSGPPTKTIVTQVTGSNPGYGATCVAILTAALTILKESDKMPGKGGVLTPGSAFAKTNITSELSRNGLVYEVLSNNDEKSKDE